MFDGEEPLRGNSTDYKTFMMGPIWADMKHMLLERRELIRDDLEGAVSLDEIRALQGEATSIHTLLSIPERLLQEALDNENDG